MADGSSEPGRAGGCLARFAARRGGRGRAGPRTGKSGRGGRPGSGLLRSLFRLDSPSATGQAGRAGLMAASSRSLALPALRRGGGAGAPGWFVALAPLGAAGGGRQPSVPCVPGQSPEVNSTRLRQAAPGRSRLYHAPPRRAALGGRGVITHRNLARPLSATKNKQSSAAARLRGSLLETRSSFREQCGPTFRFLRRARQQRN